jgi:hypothetical protein
MNIKKFNSFNENNENTNYMFFANLQHICRMASEIMEMDESQIDEMLTDGHDWANDHISKSMESISHVYNFLNSSDIESEEGENFGHEFEAPEIEDQFSQEIEEIHQETPIEERVKTFKKFK